MNHKRNRSHRRSLGLLAALSLVASTLALAVGASTAGADTTIRLCASPGSASVDDPANEGLGPVNVGFFGFSVNTRNQCRTAANPVLGDPNPLRLIEGEVTNVILYNETGFDINFSAAGLTGAPDLDGVPDGGTKTYTFTPGTPGTYIFESSLDTRHSLIGLTGVIVVDPAVSGTETAHDTPASSYDSEQVVVLSEVDPAFNLAWDTASLLDFDPSLYLLNGRTHTSQGSNGPASLAAAAGERVLLRYANVGSINSSMTALGVRQSIVAFDGEVQNGLGQTEEEPYDLSQVFVTAGQTADAIVTVAGDPGDTIAVFNRNLRTSATGDNGAQLMQIEVTDIIVPVVTEIYFSAAPTNRTYMGTVVADADVALYDGSTVSIHFDGAAHGLDDFGGNEADINAVHVDPITGDVWFSLRYDYPVPTAGSHGATIGAEWADLAAAGTLQENDVYHWDGSVFSLWLDGSFIGLDDNRGRHDINAVHVNPTAGITSFSTSGSIQPADGVPIATGSSSTLGARNEDIISWTEAVPGLPLFGGSFAPVADMSDLGMALENVDAVSLTATSVAVSVTNDFGASFDRNDLILCDGHTQPGPGALLDQCAAPLSIQFDADILHAGGNAAQIDAYSVG